MKIIELDEILEIVEEAKQELEFYHNSMDNHIQRTNLAILINRIDDVIFTIDKTI